MKLYKALPIATIVLLLFLSFATTSCSDDDGYSLNDYWVGIGTIKTDGMQGGYYMSMDNGDKLFPSAQNFHYNAVDGQRAIINYTILYDEEEFYDHSVKVNYISNILTKTPIVLNNSNQDSIGNDKVQILDIWMHEGFLNIIFGYNGSGSGIKHFINLADNTTQEKPDDGQVHLEFRHNANNDPANYGFQSIVSFDVTKVLPNGATKGTIAMKANTFKDGIKTFTIEVDLDDDSKPTISQQSLDLIGKETKSNKY